MSASREALTNALDAFYAKVQGLYSTGQAKEHAYRPAQIPLFDAFEDVLTLNDSTKTDAGYPDFTYLRKSNPELTRGYGEGKDLGLDLDKIEKTDQLVNYAAYDNLMLTNVLEYRFYTHGEPLTCLGAVRMVRRTLSHDMSADEFADMYAQTLVYGLFAARYHDPDLETFSRQEARDLIANESNFLRHFFDHIAGASFPPELLLVVNELCEVLRVSDVRTIVTSHLRAGDHHGRDPIIYFYELFLSDYDAVQRKDRGVYYTPTPVVRYIVRSVDRAIVDRFGIADGLADAEKKKYTVEVTPAYTTNKRKKRTSDPVYQGIPRAVRNRREGRQLRWLDSWSGGLRDVGALGTEARTSERGRGRSRVARTLRGGSHLRSTRSRSVSGWTRHGPR